MIDRESEKGKTEYTCGRRDASRLVRPENWTCRVRIKINVIKVEIIDFLTLGESVGPGCGTLRNTVEKGKTEASERSDGETGGWKKNEQRQTKWK